MDDFRRPHRAHGSRNSFERLGERLLDYVRTRTTDHWIMFAAGLALGLFLG